MKGVKQILENVEHGGYKSQASLDINRQAMSNPLQLTDYGYQGESGFDKQASIPSSFLADFHVFRNTVSIPKTVISQHKGLTNHGFHQRIEVLIVYIHRGPIPSDHPTKIIEQPAKLDAHTPAAFILAFLSDWLQTAVLADRENQLDRVVVDHRKEGWLRHQEVTPILMCLEQALESGSFRQCTISKPITVIPFQPAIEGAEVATFQRKQDANRYPFARIQLGLGMSRQVRHRCGNQIENV